MHTVAAPAISPELVQEHGLTPEEYEKLKQLLGGREPTITELGIFSVMWSEHCSYKSSRVYLKRLPIRSRRVVQGPGENAGIIDIGDGWACAFKIESHNHPSFIEPFQGAATGVGGILRDIFTMGARPVAIMDSLRFGPIAGCVGTAAPGRPGEPSSPIRTSSQSEIHKNHSLLAGVVSGIASYGNCFGVPNLGGETKFEPCYSGNPLVNAFALGLVKKDQIFYARAAGEGNPVIYVGAKTGRDGIHGATMASEEFSEASEAKRPNVQVGDPFLEKLLLEACLEAMQTGAIVGIQDMGAAGLTCSTCEMGARGHVGIEIELDRVPQRETGMTPYEIMLSESQERMLLVAEKGREREVLDVFQKWGLDAVVVGQVNDGGMLVVKDHGQIAAQIPAHPLAEEGPVYRRPVAQPARRQETEKDWFSFAPEGTNLAANFVNLLASPAIGSKRWISEQYDTSVRTNTLAGPGASDAAVVRIKDPKTGVVKRALALSTDGNGRWCQLNPRVGAMHAVAEAARNVACSGARPIGATNCLNFGSPEKPEVMWQFSEVIDSLTEACNVLGTPITGGNVSFYNETLGNSIYPTPIIGMLGVLEDASRVLKIAFRNPGDVILLLDGGAGLGGLKLATRHSPLATSEFAHEFSSSEYSKTIASIVSGEPPAIDLAAEKRLIDCLVALASEGAVQSAHDISDGGLAVTLAESCFASSAFVGAQHVAPQLGNQSNSCHSQRSEESAFSILGANIGLDDALPAEFALFNERGARAVVSVKPSSLARVLDTARQYRVAARVIGKVTHDSSFRIEHKGRAVIESSVETLRDAWANSLERSVKLS
jgi:phosphoribosylformylglycinamidine synthase subunit PurL